MGAKQGVFCIEESAFLGIGDGRHEVVATLALYSAMVELRPLDGFLDTFDTYSR